MFIPCDDVMTKDTDICFGYVILKHRKKNKNSFNRLNTVKRNTNILVQIILWLWNISEINTLNVWWENFVEGHAANYLYKHTKNIGVCHICH